MTGERKYLYGPVPSRRLGLSFGVDIVPFKICTLDCVYCQLGRTGEKTTQRRDFGPVDPILAELKEAVSEGCHADFVTIGGSGEPTLNLRLAELVDGIKNITDIPVALLTNGTLFDRPDVRSDCARLDVVLPSLDAADQETFHRIDRPESTISIEQVISGLCKLREEFRGQIWLEVFLVRSVNSAPAQIARIKDAVARIRPDRIQLNTAVRPTADPDVVRLDADELERIAAQLGPTCEVVADFAKMPNGRIEAADTSDELILHSRGVEIRQALLSMLKRRPCSLDDISAGLSIGRGEASRYVCELQEQGRIRADRKGGNIFFTSTC